MRTLENTAEIDAPPAVVWRVLTTRDLVREWAAAFLEDIDIRSGWREGAPVEWKAPDGAILRRGVVGRFEPERLLRFDYPLDPESLSPARSGAFSDAWAISGDGRGCLLTATTGPLTAEHYAQLAGPAREAVATIKSLAEEAAAIRRPGVSPSAKP
jgi:uncharacterized protein YndB with AHSA1/START domain